MTPTETIDNIVVANLKNENLEDSKENRLAALLEMQAQWDDNVGPSWLSSMAKATLALKIYHLQMQIRLNLD